MQTVIFGDERISPSKIVCVGRNYLAHIEELGNEKPDQMVVFSKPNSAIAATPSTRGPDEIHYEAEICFLCRQGSYAGVGVGLDLTKRKIQDTLRKEGLPWERSKAFDGAAVLSEFVPFTDRSSPIQLELRINGSVAQSASSAMMIFSPDKILSEITSFMTLHDDDVVMSGTPSGVGVLKAGDLLEASIAQEGNVLVSARWQVS